MRILLLILERLVWGKGNGQCFDIDRWFGVSDSIKNTCISKKFRTKINFLKKNINIFFNGLSPHNFLFGVRGLVFGDLGVGVFAGVKINNF